MKYYVFNSSALLLMERTIRESYCPEENEIKNADVDFPTKSKLSPTGHQQKWLEIRQKLTMEGGFVAHKAAPNLAIISSDTARCTFYMCHVQPDKTHRSWTETWKQISSVYQTNSKCYGVPQNVYQQLFLECECWQNSNVPVEGGEVNSRRHGDSNSDSSSDENEDSISSDEDSKSSTPSFSQLGSTPSVSSQWPFKRRRRLSKEDYQVYEVPHHQLDEHIEDISKQYGLHLVKIRVGKHKFKAADGTVCQGKETVFACHRSGNPRRERTAKSRNRVSKKVGCTFCVKALVPDHTNMPVQIYLHSTHCNHTPGSAEDQKWLPVDQRVVNIAADSLAAGLSIQETFGIIENALSSGNIGEIDKCRYRALPTRKELSNWKRKREHKLRESSDSDCDIHSIDVQDVEVMVDPHLGGNKSDMTPADVTSMRDQLKSQLAKLLEAVSQVDSSVEQMTKHECQQTIDVVDSVLCNLQQVGLKRNHRVF